MNFDRVARHDPIAVTDEDREAAVVVPVIRRTARASDGTNTSERASGSCSGDGEFHVLFTKRADHLPDHPGQMSFPGGGREPEDDDLLRTALREAHEEVGIDPQAVHVVGRLDDIRTVSGYSVRPFVGRIPDREYLPTDEEVAEVVPLPVAELVERGNYESERRDHPYYGDVRLHFFYVDGYTVWGATARMLVQFLELATDWEMPPEVDREVGPDDELPESVRDQAR